MEHIPTEYIQCERAAKSEKFPGPGTVEHPDSTDLWFG